MNIDCAICNEHIIEPENISVTRCGHIFHMNCVTAYVKRKTIECPTCSILISLSTIKKIYPTTIDIKENSRLNLEQNCSLPYNSKKPVGFEDLDSDSHSTLNIQVSNYENQNIELRNKLKTKEQEINNLKRVLDECTQIAQDKKKYKILQEENIQNNIYIKKLEDDNDTLQNKLHILKDELDTTKKDLENMSSRYADKNSNLLKLNEQLVKENDEMRKDIMLLNENFTSYDNAINGLLLTGTIKQEINVDMRENLTLISSDNIQANEDIERRNINWSPTSIECAISELEESLLLD